MLGFGKKEDSSSDEIKKEPEEAKNKEIEEVNDEPMDFSGEDTTEEPRVYEVSFLVVPSMTEEEVGTLVSKMKELVTKREAEILAEGSPKKITLAYPMVKSVSNKNTTYTEAYFGWVKFTLAQEKINEVKKEIDANNSIIRFLIIKSTKETPTIKPAPRRVYKKPDEEPKKTVDEKKGPVDEKELDKELEGLLTN